MNNTLFSWGYWGWGNATGQLVEATNAAEHARGFKPPIFVDIRLRRQGRAQGFVSKRVLQSCGPSRAIIGCKISQPSDSDRQQRCRDQGSLFCLPVACNC